MVFRPYKFIVISLLIFLVHPSIALADSHIIKVVANHQVGKFIEFQLQMRSTEAIESAFVFFGETGTPTTQVGELQVSTNDGNLYLLEGKFDLPGLPIRVYSRINYYFKINFLNKSVVESQIYQLLYQDNRFNWQKLEKDTFHIHWYQGDQAFAQKILNMAESSIQHIQELIPLPLPESMDIYIYSSVEDMAGALTTNNIEWIAGHSEPDLGVILVTLPPGPDQDLLIEQRIPHEMMHIFLGFTVGKTPTGLPAWFEEGLASNAELYPNPDYAYILENARKRGALLPMETICKAFPRDAANAYLAYAQSASFVRYLYDRFGSSGMLKLLSVYKDGQNCDYGLQNTLHRSLRQLEKEWRADILGENTWISSISQLSPWFVLLLVVIAAPTVFIFINLRKNKR